MKKIIIAVTCLAIAVGASAQEKFYSKVTASYNYVSLNTTISHATTSGSFSGMSLNYLAGFNIGGKNYLETGLSGHYFWDAEFKNPALTLPVNYTYRFAFKDGKMHLAPFAGLYGRLGLSCKEEELDLYDAGFKRFQMGLQGGVSFDVKKFYVSVGYACDMLPYATVRTVNTTTITESDVIFSQAIFSVGVTF